MNGLILGIILDHCLNALKNQVLTLVVCSCNVYSSSSTLISKNIPIVMIAMGSTKRKVFCNMLYML